MTAPEWLSAESTIERSKRPYAHFDPRTDLGKKAGYVSDPHKVAAHGFYPLIHYTQSFTRYGQKKGRSVKERDICYAAHIDRCIYQYYGFLLNERYNERLKQAGLWETAVAYRTDLHQNNIDFAKRMFDTIKALGACHVMIGDFTHFFDDLDHAYLKKQWCSLLGCSQLPKDHYKVFRSITAYSFWELTDLLSLNGLDNDRRGRRNLNRQARVLTPEQFRQNRSHIKKHTEPYGIPQGSPVSGVLANMYMLEVDGRINELVGQQGGSYMRYSDDFMIVLPESCSPDQLFGQVQAILKTAPRLTLQPSKTQFFHYAQGAVENCGRRFLPEADESSRFINFLGFTFDGQEITIRGKTLSKYYYRMYRKAKNLVILREMSRYRPKKFSSENLYLRYSERGEKVGHGNFLTYVSRAQRAFGRNEPIGRDTRRHMEKIAKALKKSYTSGNGTQKKSSDLP